MEVCLLLRRKTLHGFNCTCMRVNCWTWRLLCLQMSCHNFKCIDGLLSANRSMSQHHLHLSLQSRLRRTWVGSAVFLNVYQPLVWTITSSVPPRLPLHPEPVSEARVRHLRLQSCRLLSVLLNLTSLGSKRQWGWRWVQFSFPADHWLKSLSAESESGNFTIQWEETSSHPDFHQKPAGAASLFPHSCTTHKQRKFCKNISRLWQDVKRGTDLRSSPIHDPNQTDGWWRGSDCSSGSEPGSRFLGRNSVDLISPVSTKKNHFWLWHLKHESVYFCCLFFVKNGRNTLSVQQMFLFSHG